MTAYIALMGLAAFRLGLVTTTDEAGATELLSPNLAGCGMAAYLGAACAMVMT
jgi:hypothetical protein